MPWKAVHNNVISAFKTCLYVTFMVYDTELFDCACKETILGAV